MSTIETTNVNEAAAVENGEGTATFSPDLTPEVVRDFVASLNVSEKVVTTFFNLASTLVNIGSANRARNALYELRTGTREVKVQGPSGTEDSVWEPVYDELAADAVTILEMITESAGSEDDLDEDNPHGLAGQINALKGTITMLDLPQELDLACDVMLSAVATAMTVSGPKAKITQLPKAGGGSRGAIPDKVANVFKCHPGERFSLADLNKQIPEHGTGALGAALNRMVAQGSARAVVGISSSGREATLYMAA